MELNKRSQSRQRSVAEAATNTVGGYVINLITQAVVFPLFGFHASFGQNIKIGAIFFLVSFARGYGVRRLFSWYD